MNAMIIFFLIINLFNNIYSANCTQNKKILKCLSGIIIKKPTKNNPKGYKRYSKEDKKKVLKLMSENPKSSYKEIAEEANIKYSVVVSWIKKNRNLKSTKLLAKPKSSSRGYVKHSKETIKKVLDLAGNKKKSYNKIIIAALELEGISLTKNQVKNIKHVYKSKKKDSISNTPNSNTPSGSRKNSLSELESDEPNANLSPEPLNSLLPNNSVNLLPLKSNFYLKLVDFYLNLIKPTESFIEKQENNNPSVLTAIQKIKSLTQELIVNTIEIEKTNDKNFDANPIIKNITNCSKKKSSKSGSEYFPSENSSVSELY